jgi:hypothetical protein
MPLGIPATLEGLTAFEVFDAFPVPTEFIAETWKVYVQLFVRFVTTIEVFEDAA